MVGSTKRWAGDAALERVREICLALPEVNERLSHGHPAFFIRDKKTLLSFHDGHHEEGVLSAWVPAPPGVQEQMVEAEPERFYRPPYVGHLGWIGVRLDVDPDYDELATIVEEAYRHVAPKKLSRLLDADDR